MGRDMIVVREVCGESVPSFGGFASSEVGS